MDGTYYRIGEVSQVTGISRTPFTSITRSVCSYPIILILIINTATTHSEICGSWISLQPAES